MCAKPFGDKFAFSAFSYYEMHQGFFGVFNSMLIGRMLAVLLDYLCNVASFGDKIALKTIIFADELRHQLMKNMLLYI